MNQKEAKQIIQWWFQLPSKEKDRNWDRVVPYINKYPEIYEEGKHKWNFLWRLKQGKEKSILKSRHSSQK